MGLSVIRHAAMRRYVCAITVMILLAPMAASEEPYLHAPTPPYCSPRGGEPNCISEKPWNSRGHYAERWLDPQVILTEVDDLLPTLRDLHEVETHEASLFLLGRVKLRLLAHQDGPVEAAFLVLESEKQLTDRRARRIKRHFRSQLSSDALRWIVIERASRAYEGRPAEDVCEFEREDSSSDWDLLCDH
jgi:hypothetical protein